MLQFPLSFEFNDHFLSTIAYHHVSMRFRTFLLDSEHERSESGWMAEEEHKPRGKSLWDYMDLQKSKTPLYNNFLFSPNQHKVCKVMNNIFSREGAAITRGSVSVLIMQKTYSICSVWANPFCLCSILLNKPFGSLVTIFWVILVTSRVTFKLKVKYAFKLRCTSGGVLISSFSRSILTPPPPPEIKGNPKNRNLFR